MSLPALAQASGTPAPTYRSYTIRRASSWASPIAAPSDGSSSARPSRNALDRARDVERRSADAQDPQHAAFDQLPKAEEQLQLHRAGDRRFQRFDLLPLLAEAQDASRAT